MPVDPKNRPIRVINDDTTDEEMRAGHHIPNADPPKNEAARGGFGNRDGKQGFGSDTAGGATALGVNEEADSMTPPADNMRSDDEDRPARANQDLPARETYADDADLVAVHDAGRPVDELDADDRRKGPDEMENPNSHVGMGEMAPKTPKPVTSTATNAELTDANATDTAIDQ